MKKSDSKSNKETLKEEVKRLRKENAKLKSQKAAKEAKLKEARKELKKKDVKTVTVTEEQMKLLSNSKHSKKCTFYTLRFGCSFAAVNTIKPQLLKFLI